MKPEFKLFDRREFVNFVSKTAAILGLTGVAASAKAAGQSSSNAFAYDISKLQKTDPKFIAYQELTRWRCPRKEVKRLAVGPDDRLLVCAGNYLTAFDSEGRPGREIVLPDPACCAAVDKDGTLYAGLRDSIEVFDVKGEHRATWASPDRKSWFTGLAVGANDVFVADSGQRVILRYDKTGKLIGRIGEKNAGRNVPGFIVPSPYPDGCHSSRRPVAGEQSGPAPCGDLHVRRRSRGRVGQAHRRH